MNGFDGRREIDAREYRSRIVQRPNTACDDNRDRRHAGDALKMQPAPRLDEVGNQRRSLHRPELGQRVILMVFVHDLYRHADPDLLGRAIDDVADQARSLCEID